MKMYSWQDLQKAREASRQRYQDIAAAILRDAGVESIEYFQKQGRAHAFAKKKHVKICRPTTKRRLFTAAHEAGHVFMNHRGSKRSYVQEYEATIYAIDKLREQRVSIPRKIVDRYKRYVVRKIDMGLRRGGSQETLDRKVLDWCGKYWEAYLAANRSMLAAYRVM